jgi:hypothetical protein
MNRSVEQTIKKPRGPHGVAGAQNRRVAAVRSQEIEDHPLDAADIAIFRMFELVGWPPESCRANILAPMRRALE